MHKEWHLPPIPDGLQIFANELEIKGIQHYRADATAFVTGTDQSLWFVRDELNQHDANAIAIHGAWKGWFFRKQGLLGYVEREVAKAIVENDWWGRVLPRLRKTYVSDGGFLEVYYDVLAPKTPKAKRKRAQQPVIV